jgi:hypothetical protein
MKIGRLVFGLCLAMGVVAIAQHALTNESIERVARARFGDDVVASLMQNLGPLAAGLCLALSAVAVAQETFTKKSTHARFGDEVVVSLMQNHQFELPANTLIEGNREGITQVLDGGCIDASRQLPPDGRLPWNRGPLLCHPGGAQPKA